MVVNTVNFWAARMSRPGCQIDVVLALPSDSTVATTDGTAKSLICELLRKRPDDAQLSVLAARANEFRVWQDALLSTARDEPSDFHGIDDVRLLNAHDHTEIGWPLQLPLPDGRGWLRWWLSPTASVSLDEHLRMSSEVREGDLELALRATRQPGLPVGRASILTGTSDRGVLARGTASCLDIVGCLTEVLDHPAFGEEAVRRTAYEREMTPGTRPISSRALARDAGVPTALVKRLHAEVAQLCPDVLYRGGIGRRRSG